VRVLFKGGIECDDEWHTVPNVDTTVMMTIEAESGNDSFYLHLLLLPTNEITGCWI